MRWSFVETPPDTLPHIFDVFVQSEPAPDTAQNGIGLGLFLVKQDGSMTSNKRRVLVVDDDRDLAHTLARLLELLDHEVVAAQDGTAALAAAEAFRPDAIVLDLTLPGRDGIELARTIRAAPWGKHVLLIASTGWGHPDARRRSHEAGFDHHLVKPVNLAQLNSLLATARHEPQCGVRQRQDSLPTDNNQDL